MGVTECKLRSLFPPDVVTDFLVEISSASQVHELGQAGFASLFEVRISDQQAGSGDHIAPSGTKLGITEQELRSLFEYGLVVYFYVVTSSYF